MPIDFHLNFQPPSLSQKIYLSDHLFLIGSCFTNHLHEKLHLHKFKVLKNPHGVLFNPVSICNSLDAYINCRTVSESELFLHQSLWHHWDFHSSFSHEHPNLALQIMNQSIEQTHEFLKKTKWVFVTVGSSFVYQNQSNHIVANCHKFPSDTFTKHILKPQEIASRFIKIIHELLQFNKNINIIFTVSPVRHLRDGLIENNRSKAILFYAIDLIKDEIPQVAYFPAYELIVDDLRDYRFYAEDMVHPNYLATQYVWEKFVDACIDGKSKEAMKEINQLQQAVKHIPLHPASSEHFAFKRKSKERALELSKRFPFLDFSKEILHFS